MRSLRPASRPRMPCMKPSGRLIWCSVRRGPMRFTHAILWSGIFATSTSRSSTMPGFRYTMSWPEKFSWGCARVSRVGDAPLMRGFSPPPTADLRSAFLWLISARIASPCPRSIYSFGARHGLTLPPAHSSELCASPIGAGPVAPRAFFPPITFVCLPGSRTLSPFAEIDR